MVTFQNMIKLQTLKLRIRQKMRLGFDTCALMWMQSSHQVPDDEDET